MPKISTGYGYIRTSKPKKDSYWCKKCQRRHWLDSKIGKVHFSQRGFEDIEKRKINEFKKHKGIKVEMQRGSSYVPAILTGNRKPNYIEVEGIGWVHQSKIFMGGSKKIKLPPKYELKKGEKGFWEI